MPVKNQSAEEGELMFIQDLKRRALAAYYRAGGIAQPDAGMTGVYSAECATKGGFNVNGEPPVHTYIRLANVNGTLAVFREMNSGVLKRLKRWPQSVETGEAEALADLYVALAQHKPDPALLAEHPELAAVADELSAAA